MNGVVPEVVHDVGLVEDGDPGAVHPGDEERVLRDLTLRPTAGGRCGHVFDTLVNFSLYDDPENVLGVSSKDNKLAASHDSMLNHNITTDTFL